jgi:hypothetical protein
MGKSEKPQKPGWSIVHPWGARFGDTTGADRVPKGESNPELYRQQVEAAMAPTRKPGDSPAQDFVDAVIDERMRWNLMTHDQRAREDRARKLEAAGYVEVGGTVVKKDEARKLSQEASDERISMDELMALHRANKAIWDEPNPDALGEDAYWERQEAELEEEMNDW